ncbi:hypothetical protein THAOC_04225 [Thalassiosira oceanica]|uniref:Aminotransferase class I/classII large domain-containing protein n=1 Tax=Thalassiosira oceanica TaxID=159749 RepID=K0T5R3_THAOC|nr:hypothetical protein THAOC_04225 [Thalassiosira oceanica]|eukprot:EJK74118.1 hypothetical protein THAOC_04225 [Thalassiosira oceanica]
MSNKVVPVAVLTAAVVGIVALDERNEGREEKKQHYARGCIPLCVAENKLVIDLLSQRLVQSETAVRAFHDASVFCYNNFLGLPSARASLAYFIAKHIMYPEQRNLSYNDALQIVDPEFVAFGSGGSSLLSHLALSLCERGDAVLIPAPYYAAFDADLRIVAGCVAVPVHMKDPCVPTSDELEAAARAAESRGMRVRVRECPRLCVPFLHSALTPSCALHALSKRFSARHQPAQPARNHLPSSRRQVDDRLGPNKRHAHDRGRAVRSLCSRQPHRIRIGAAHAGQRPPERRPPRLGALEGLRRQRFPVRLAVHSKQLLSALANLNIFSGVSHPMQAMMAEVLRDDDFVYRFVETSRQRIRRSYEMCASRLDEMVIPYTRATSGIFVYADFSSLLPEQSPEGEARFTELLLDAAKVILTPGHAQHDLRPGMYRICYTFVSPELLDVALARLDRLVVKIRRCHWDNLNTTTFKGIIE